MTVAPAAKAHKGWIETAVAVALYAVYELVRGFGGSDYLAAKLHTADIVAFERRAGLCHEFGIQHVTAKVPGLPAVLGAASITLPLVATVAFLVWVFRSRRRASPSSAFADTVSAGTGLNLSSDLLGALYNPLAAVPSLHFGYSLLVGAACVRSLGGAARRRLPGVHALHDRRDRQPLPARRDRRRHRGRRRVARRSRRARLDAVAAAVDDPQRVMLAGAP